MLRQLYEGLQSIVDYFWKPPKPVSLSPRTPKVVFTFKLTSLPLIDVLGIGNRAIAHDNVHLAEACLRQGYDPASEDKLHGFLQDRLHLHLANYYLKQNKIQKAIRYFLRVKEEGSPYYQDANHQLGNLFFHREPRDLTQAKFYYQRAALAGDASSAELFFLAQGLEEKSEEPFDPFNEKVQQLVKQAKPDIRFENLYCSIETIYSKKRSAFDLSWQTVNGDDVMALDDPLTIELAKGAQSKQKNIRKQPAVQASRKLESCNNPEFREAIKGNMEAYIRLYMNKGNFKSEEAAYHPKHCATIKQRLSLLQARVNEAIQNENDDDLLRYCDQLVEDDFNGKTHPWRNWFLPEDTFGYSKLKDEIASTLVFLREGRLKRNTLRREVYLARNVELGKVQCENGILKQDKQLMQTQIEKKDAEIQTLKEGTKIPQLEAEVQSLIADKSKLIEENKELKNQVQATTQTNAKLESKINQVVQENSGLQVKVGEFTQQITNLTQENKSLKIEVGKLDQTIGGLNQTIEILNKTIGVLKDDFKQEINALKESVASQIQEAVSEAVSKEREKSLKEKQVIRQEADRNIEMAKQTAAKNAKREDFNALKNQWTCPFSQKLIKTPIIYFDKSHKNGLLCEKTAAEGLLATKGASMKEADIETQKNLQQFIIHFSNFVEEEESLKMGNNLYSFHAYNGKGSASPSAPIPQTNIYQ